LTGATAGYVALLSDDGQENEVLFLEPGEHACTVDPSLPMPIRGLREEAYRTNKAVWDNAFADSTWNDFLPAGHVRLRNIMFAPLVIKGRTDGVIGLANKTGDFDENDAEMVCTLGDLCAVALRNSRNLDHLLHETIAKLEKALAEVRTLRGIIPICAGCKKIRNEQGYWQQVEQYIMSHSEAEFSHGLCEDCVESLYARRDG
jgi:GAF domain-containing protein